MKTKLFLVTLLSSTFALAGTAFGSSKIDEISIEGQATIQHPTCLVSSLIISNDGGFTNDFAHAGRSSYKWLANSQYGSLIQASREPVTDENEDKPTFNKMVEQRLIENGFEFGQDDEKSLKIIFRVDNNVKTYGIVFDNSFTTSYYSFVRVFQKANGKFEETYDYFANSNIFKRSPYIPTTNKTIAAHYDAVTEAALENLPSCELR